jgi:hypothetical protein
LTPIRDSPLHSLRSRSFFSGGSEMTGATRGATVASPGSDRPCRVLRNTCHRC